VTSAVDLFGNSAIDICEPMEYGSDPNYEVFSYNDTIHPGASYGIRFHSDMPSQRFVQVTQENNNKFKSLIQYHLHNGKEFEKRCNKFSAMPLYYHR